MPDSPSIEEKDTKPVEDLSASTNAQDTVIAEDSSTSGESDSKEISTFDLVKQAIEETAEEKDETEGSSEKDKSKGDAPEEGDKPKDEVDEITEEELGAMKHKTRKRFEQLQGKYKEEKEKSLVLETKFTELNQKLEQTEVDAVNYRNVTGFLQSNNLNQEEANTGLNIMAMMKNEPLKALEALTPFYNELLRVTGNILPEDIQQQVEQGYITEQNALELSRQRALNQNFQAQQQVQQHNQQQQQVVNRQKLQGEIGLALSNLENTWKTSDPDYKLKSSRLHDRVKLMWIEESRKGILPKSIEEAVRMVEKVKREVDSEVRQFIPKKPVNPIDGGGSGSTVSKPNSTLDVIRNALGQ